MNTCKCKLMLGTAVSLLLATPAVAANDFIESWYPSPGDAILDGRPCDFFQLHSSGTWYSIPRVYADPNNPGQTVPNPMYSAESSMAETAWLTGASVYQWPLPPWEPICGQHGRLVYSSPNGSISTLYPSPDDPAVDTRPCVFFQAQGDPTDWYSIPISDPGYDAEVAALAAAFFTTSAASQPFGSGPAPAACGGWPHALVVYGTIQ